MRLPIVFAWMLLLASAGAIATRRLRIPYTVSLALVSLLFAALRQATHPVASLQPLLSPEVLFAALLPPLLYEAGLQLELRTLLANWRSVFLLTGGVTVVGVGVTSVAIHGAFQLLGHAVPLVTVALISICLASTDPKGVIAPLRATGAPRRLWSLIEGESVMSDGVALIAFAVAMAVRPGARGDLDPGVLVQVATWKLAGSLLLGGGLGVFLSWLASRLEDHLFEITLTTVAAFGGFLIADTVGASGALACLIAGLLAGNFGVRYGAPASTRVTVTSFWNYAGFVATCVAFLAAAMMVHPRRLLQDWAPVLLVWLALGASRALLVGLLMPRLRRVVEVLPLGAGPIIGWGGVRGALGLILVLGLPSTTPGRELILNCVFGATVLTILVQSTTMGVLLRAFNLTRDRRAFDVIQRLRGRVRTLFAARNFLQRQREAGAVPEDIFHELQQELIAEQRAIERERSQARAELAQMRREEAHALRRSLLLVRKEALREAAAEGAIDEEAMRALVGELDGRLRQLDDLAEEQRRHIEPLAPPPGQRRADRRRRREERRRARKRGRGGEKGERKPAGERVPAGGRGPEEERRVGAAAEDRDPEAD